MSEGMLEQRTKFILSVKKNKPLDIVEKNFQDYLNAYDDYEPTIEDKLEHREMFYKYCKYMKKNDRDSANSFRR